MLLPCHVSPWFGLEYQVQGLAGQVLVNITGLLLWWCNNYTTITTNKAQLLLMILSSMLINEELHSLNWTIAPKLLRERRNHPGLIEHLTLRHLLRHLLIRCENTPQNLLRNALDVLGHTVLLLVVRNDTADRRWLTVTIPVAVASRSERLPPISRHDLEMLPLTSVTRR